MKYTTRAFPSEQPGMSLRAYFAGQALTGLAAAHDSEGTWAIIGCEREAAQEAIKMADMLLDELAKGDQ